MRVTPLGLLQAAAALTVAFTVVTVFDSLHHGIELFVHFRLQYFVVALLMAVAFTALRRFAWGGALLATAIINGLYVAPLYLGAAQPPHGETLKIMHANVHASSDEYQRVVDVIAAESPDVVFLLEVTDAWMNGTRQLASQYAYRYAEPRADNFGVAVFSRVPLAPVRHVDSPPLGYPTIVAEATFAGQSVTLISTHPTIPLGRQGFEARNEQLAHVAGIVAESGDATILVGDLNVTAWSHSFRSFLGGLGLRDGRRGFGVLPTWPVFMPFAMIPIDHVLVSNDVAVIELRRGPRIGSDHLPLIFTIAM